MISLSRINNSNGSKSNKLIIRTCMIRIRIRISKINNILNDTYIKYICKIFKL